MTTLNFLFASAILAFLAPAPQLAAHGSDVRTDSPRSSLSGREADARVARIAWRLAMSARGRCPQLDSATGLVLQHLSQFQQGDRAEVIATLPLDRGPGVIAIVLEGPAAKSGIEVGDVLLAINNVAVPAEPDLATPFDVGLAHTRADAIMDLLQLAHEVTLLRDGVERTVRLAPLPACPSRVHLARSAQRNAFADGRHVFLTTGMLALLRNEDELAFLIAHEMAHNVLGHATVMRNSRVSRRETRALETAADRLGGEMMLDAGYDPVTGAALLTRIGGSDFGIALFARHEPVARRVAALRTLAQARRAP